MLIYRSSSGQMLNVLYAFIETIKNTTDAIVRISCCKTTCDLDIIVCYLLCSLSPGPTWPNIFFQLFTMEINSAFANNLKSIVLMKIQCVTIYPNILNVFAII